MQITSWGNVYNSKILANLIKLYSLHKFKVAQIDQTY
jgi:hypothetical protein